MKFTMERETYDTRQKMDSSKESKAIIEASISIVQRFQSFPLNHLSDAGDWSIWRIWKSVEKGWIEGWISWLFLSIIDDWNWDRWVSKEIEGSDKILMAFHSFPRTSSESCPSLSLLCPQCLACQRLFGQNCESLDTLSGVRLKNWIRLLIEMISSSFIRLKIFRLKKYFSELRNSPRNF